MSAVAVDVPVPLSVAMVTTPHEVLGPQLLGFLRPTQLPMRVADALVQLARATDTPDAYTLGKHTVVRGVFQSGAEKWKIKPGYLHAIDAQVRAHGDHKRDMEEALDFSLSLHYKRLRGALTYPGLTYELVFVLSQFRDGAEGVWMDATASDDPPQTAERPVPPKRRDTALVIDRIADPRFPLTCRRCCNRYSETLQICGKCRTMRYCCRECQSDDWPAHKGRECDLYGSKAPVNRY